MERLHPDRSLIALGVRQPWAELIIQGAKTIEVRTVSTRIRGTIYLYSSKIPSEMAQAIAAADRHSLKIDALTYGQLVGTVDIVDCRPLKSDDLRAACLTEELPGRQFAWCLTNPIRLPTPLSVRFLPYGVWFYPFERRGSRRN